MKTVQIIPAGSRQVAPGIFQMARRGAARGGHHPKKHHGPKRSLPMMSQSFVRYVKLLNSFRNIAKSFTAPSWLNVPALLLYMHGQNKNDKGAMNVAKTLLLDQAQQMNPQIAALLNAGAGDLGMLGLIGGFGTGGGAFGGGIPGGNPMIQMQSAPQQSSGPSTDVNNAVALINALQTSNNNEQVA